MLTYVVRRFLIMIPTVFLISILAFAVIQAPPGDYLTSQIDALREQYGPAADRYIEALRHRYGLEQPLYVQYYRWMQGIVLRGHFGMSFAENRPVNEILRTRIPLTVIISAATLAFTWMVAIPIGVYSAVKQYTVFDYFFTFLAFIGQSIPNFLLALVLMFFFYSMFGWSLGGLFSPEYQGQPWTLDKIVDMLRHMILPVIVIGTAGTAGLVRVLRGMMLDEFGKQYVQTARSKGLTERVILWKHVIRIAILPLVATVGWLLPQIVSGAMITSIVLNLPTTGAAMYNALMLQDMYVAGSVVLILSTLTIIGTLLSDILLAVIDPRIRYD